MGIDLGLANFLDIQENFFVRQLGELSLQGLYFSPLFTDDDPGASGKDVDFRLACGTLNLYPGDASVVESLLEVVAELDVLMYETCIILGREPTRFPGLDDPESESYGMNFLAQLLTSSSCLFLVQNHGNVAGRFTDTSGTTLGTR